MKLKFIVWLCSFELLQSPPPPPPPPNWPTLAHLSLFTMSTATKKVASGLRFLIKNVRIFELSKVKSTTLAKKNQDNHAHWSTDTSSDNPLRSPLSESFVFFFSDATRGKLFHNGVGHGTTKSWRSLNVLSGTLADSAHEHYPWHGSSAFPPFSP